MRKNEEEAEIKRISMDLGVLLECSDCPQIVHCYGYFIKETEVSICMELMSTCFDKLIKKLIQPIPEPIIGKIAVSVSQSFIPCMLSLTISRHPLTHGFY